MRKMNSATSSNDANHAYNPDRLLDALISKIDAKNDAQLCRHLEVQPPVISKIRHRRMPISASLLIRMHETCGIDVREMQALMGDRRTKFRMSDARGSAASRKAE